jgi:hypothetical protein
MTTGSNPGGTQVITQVTQVAYFSNHFTAARVLALSV